MDYEAVIGLEVHVKLNTDTKIFCGCEAGFGGEENTRCCPVCTGMPGSLPVLNRRVVELCVTAGLLMNCGIHGVSTIARKNYFYPDLPKNYQISQHSQPICGSGYMDFNQDGRDVRVRIHHIHIEEDAGKLIHDRHEKYSSVDYNRCGSPLIEIVTEPDIRHAADAKRFLEELRSMLITAGVSNCRMEEGGMRCDVNISIRPVGVKAFSTRVEIKNMNSLSGIQSAIEHEINRQKDLVAGGGEVVQTTLTWDENTEEVREMRTKEEAEDYRYFVDPDLVPVEINNEWVERIKSSIPEMPAEKKQRYMADYGLSEYDAGYISNAMDVSRFFEESVSDGADAKTVCNFIMGDIARIMNDKGLESIPVSPGHMAELADLTKAKTINSTIAKKVLEYMFEEDLSPAEIIESNHWGQISDKSQLDGLVKTVIEGNPKSVNDYKAGKSSAMTFLMGQAMKACQGKADPKLLSGSLKRMLEEL